MLKKKKTTKQTTGCVKDKARHVLLAVGPVNAIVRDD